MFNKIIDLKQTTIQKNNFESVVPLIVFNRRKSTFYHELFDDNFEYEKREYYNVCREKLGILDVATVSHKNRSLKEKVFLDVPAFPLFQSEQRDAFEAIQKLLRENILSFLRPHVKLLETDSYLKETVLYELIDNAIQSPYNVEKRLDKENGNNHKPEYYTDKNLNGIIEVSYERIPRFNKQFNYSHITDKINIRNYAKYCLHHIKRIESRVNQKSDDTTIINLEEEFRQGDTDDMTGYGSMGLFMARKGLQKLTDGYMSFQYSYVRSIPDFGAYDFSIYLPEMESDKIN